MANLSRLRRAKTVNVLLKSLLKVGVFGLMMRRNKSALTILNYHRIDDVSRPGFDTFAPNVTASPAEFARQMDHIQRHYHVISCEYLSAWLRGERELPPYPAMITFDDGYADNYTYAYPILQARNLSAVIFLTTGLIGEDKLVYWDQIAYCFYHSRRKSAELPIIGRISWMDEDQRRTAMKRFASAVKQLPDAEKPSAVEDLAGILDVHMPVDAFSGLYLTWDQVREMSKNGIEMGSHTVEHPILTRVPLSEVEEELVRSRQKIEAEIGKPVKAFAYPNGGKSDYSSEVMRLVRQAGYEMAFTLEGGVPGWTQVRGEPFAIPRIFLGAFDTFPWFVAKLSWG
jgi:peptidoglycan/xylan/chitin deacetylase (PgdA/CDA1 family)